MQTDWDVFIDSSEEEEINHEVEDIVFNNCQHSDSVYDFQNGCEICNKCGKVLHEKLIDRSPEWRGIKSANQYMNDPIRCSIINPLLPKSSLSTKIAYSNPTPQVYLLTKMNKWQSMPYIERSMYEVFSYLEEKCKSSGISKSIIQAAKVFYANVYRKNTQLLRTGKKREGLRGKKRKGLISACLFYACKQNGEPRSQMQISQVLGIPKPFVTKGCKIFLELLKNDNQCQHVLDVVDGKHFVQQAGQIMKLNYFTIRYAIDLYEEIQDNNLFAGNQPTSIAASVIYIVMSLNNENKISEAYVAKKCGISKVTILNVCKQLEPVKQVLLFNVYVRSYYKKMPFINSIVFRKILILGKHILFSLQENILRNVHPQLIAATIIYMTLHYQNAQYIDKTWFLKQISPWTESEMCCIAKVFTFYKQSILSLLNSYILPSKHDDLRPKKKVALLYQD
jgi:transcription initiation factor TFIIB